MATQTLETGAFSALQQLIEQAVGIRLEQRESMVESRLRKLARQHGHASVTAFIQDLLQAPTKERLSEVVDRLSTNHTYFHREAEHFERLPAILEPLLAARRRTGHLDLRMWCAAASTGQEPYTLAMILREVLGADAPRWQSGLLATDISSDALAEAARGIYDADDVGRLPDSRQRWFRTLPDGRKQVDESLRRDVTYRRLNLIKGPFRFRAPFDVVFCRNVMIYFDLPVRIRLLQHMADVMAPDGWLFISLSETIPAGGDLPFRYVSPGLYRRV